MKHQLLKITMILSLGLSVIAATPSRAAQSSDQTLKNLNTAFEGESNAANRYALFAKKAEAEGYAQVAKLFRAASAAEAIHRETHMEAILGLGGTPATFQLEAVTPASTEENLKAAIKGETYERDTRYPEFLAIAKRDDARSANRERARSTCRAEQLSLPRKPLSLRTPVPTAQPRLLEPVPNCIPRETFTSEEAVPGRGEPAP